jgi:HPt (histidine-containing phosphotransfer) domain-containing protein
MTKECVINRAVFDDLLSSVGGDTAFLEELIDTYLADSVGLMAQMRESLAGNDLDGFRRAAHSLKSNSANFGATDLAAQARELEMMARAGSLEGADAKVAAVEEVFTYVSAELGRLRLAA